MIKFILIFSAIIALLFWGSADASRDELVARIAIAASLAVLFPFIYLWKLVGAPPAMEGELVAAHEAEVASLQRKLSSTNLSLSIQSMTGINPTSGRGVAQEFQIAITNTSSDTDVVGIEVRMLEARTIDGPIRPVDQALLNSDGQKNFDLTPGMTHRVTVARSEVELRSGALHIGPTMLGPFSRIAPDLILNEGLHKIEIRVFARSKSPIDRALLLSLEPRGVRVFGDWIEGHAWPISSRVPTPPQS